MPKETSESEESEDITGDGAEHSETADDMPFATPSEGQHTHLDFLSKAKTEASLLSGLIGRPLGVNQTGTEYAFEPIALLAEEAGRQDNQGELVKIYKAIAQADAQDFALTETAREMAELFRVDVDYYDPAHDREQEIENGLIQRASAFHLLRSFAWTLQAYCRKQGKQPADLSADVLSEIMTFIKERNGMNYSADSWSPTLCSGDDLHVYYVPDSISESMKTRLLDLVNKDCQDNPVLLSEIKSLHGLREELGYLYPAICTLYEKLEATRDREEALLGDEADVLYAWCSITYAAREAIYSEDGPMNCWWEHPDNRVDWELKYKIDQLKWSVAQGEEWMKNHQKDLTKNPRILFNGKTFVFAGVERMDEWLDILKALTKKGGIHRAAVSGKTNYLVCNPTDAGEAKIKHALEQRIKGNDVKIVLLDDLLSALNITVKSPQEKLDELESKPKKEESKKELPQLQNETLAAGAAQTKKTQKTNAEAKEVLSFRKNITFHGSGYSISIPDGFTLKKGAENRDFIAYLPNPENPENYLESDFILFAGEKQQNDVIPQFRVAEEFAAMMKGAEAMFAAATQESKLVRYTRPKLPGAILFGFDPECVHANFYVGVDDHVQAMRVQMTGSQAKNKASCEAAVREILDHMTADQPVQLLKAPDDASFIQMEMKPAPLKKWITCLEEYMKHYSVVRSIEQDGLVKAFQIQQFSGKASVPKLKKDLKTLLQDISGYAESVLKKAEGIYYLKQIEFYGNGNLSEMKKALSSLIEFSSQELNINDDDTKIKVTSSYAEQAKARLKLSALDAAKAYLEAQDQSDDTPLTEALKVALSEKEERIRREEEARAREIAAEEERKRIKAEKEAEERRRREEELARKQKEEEEARLKKEAEEKEQYRAAYAVYEQDHAAWERTLAEIKEKRDRFIGETQAAIRDSAEQTLKSRRDKAVNTLTNYLNAAVKYRDQLQSQRDALGLFKMREKQELKDKIADIDAKIQEARDNLQKTEDQYDNRESFIQQHVNKKMKEKEEKINQRFVFPEEPQKPQKPDSMLQRERQAAKERVPQVFAPGEKLSLMALRQKDPLFKSYTSMEFKQLLQELCDEHQLEKIAENGEQRYRLPQPEQKRKSATVGHAPQKTQRTPTKTQIVNEGIKADIIETMKPGKAYLTAAEVKMIHPSLSEISLLKIIALMRQLESEGKLEKDTENGEERYRLLPTGEERRGETQKHSTTEMPFTPTKTQLMNMNIKDEILATMNPGQSYLISDLMLLIPSLSEQPSQKIVALIRQLVSEGKLEREVIQGKAYFSLLQRQQTEQTEQHRPENMKYTPADMPRKPTPTQIVNEALKAEILEAMSSGQSYLLSDFLELNPSLAQYPSQKIVALFRELVSEGKLKREVISGKAYFSLA